MLQPLVQALPALVPVRSALYNIQSEPSFYVRAVRANFSLSSVC